MKYLVLALFFVPFVVFTQETSQVQSEVYDFPDKEAVFPGGQEAMEQFIESNLQYPETAKAKNIQGKVFISFVIELDGSISDVTVQFGSTPELNQEAIRIVKAMPKWTPAEVNGEKVRSLYRWPIAFFLNN